MSNTATSISFARAGQSGGVQTFQQDQLISPQMQNCNTGCVQTVYQPERVYQKKEVLTPQLALRPTQVVQEPMCVQPDPCAQQVVQRNNCGTYEYSYGRGWGGGFCGLFFGVWLAATVVAAIAIWALNPRWAQRGNNKCGCGKKKCDDTCGKNKCDDDGCLDGAKVLITAIIIGLIIAALVALFYWLFGCFC